MCNGYIDCGDGSDEISCAGENTMSMKNRVHASYVWYAKSFPVRQT